MKAEVTVASGDGVVPRRAMLHRRRTVFHRAESEAEAEAKTEAKTARERERERDDREMGERKRGGEE